MAEVNTRPASPESRRPLSPHLGIYRPMLTMMMSIAHRITGVGLAFGLVFFVWWLTAAAHSETYFATVQACISSWLGRTLLLGFTWALVHHGLGGLRPEWGREGAEALH